MDVARWWTLVDLPSWWTLVDLIQTYQSLLVVDLWWTFKTRSTTLEPLHYGAFSQMVDHGGPIS